MGWYQNIFEYFDNSRYGKSIRIIYLELLFRNVFRLALRAWLVSILDSELSLDKKGMHAFSTFYSDTFIATLC